MNRSSNELYDKDPISRIWSEAYRDWVSDWEDTVNKHGSSSVPAVAASLRRSASFGHRPAVKVVVNQDPGGEGSPWKRIPQRGEGDGECQHFIDGK